MKKIHFVPTCQTVIFLYLMDNDTSWMILFSSGIGLCIEYWKLAKAFNVSFGRKEQTSGDSNGHNGAGTITDADSKQVQQQVSDSSSAVVATESPSTTTSKIFGVKLPFTISWKLSDSYTSSKTREYDAIATSHLLYIVVPLVFGYSIYSLLYISVRCFSKLQRRLALCD